MKTTLAITLSVFLALTLVNFDAHAVGGSTQSKGTIEFSGTGGGTELFKIYDPLKIGDAPTIPGFTPDGPQRRKMENLDSMSLAFGNSLILSDVDQKYTSTNKTGFIVNASVEWVVTVAISGFKQGDEQTLEGFELTLIPEGGGVNISPGAVINPERVTLTAARGGTPGDYARIAKGKAGVTGCNYTGTLLVRGKTAKPGNARATLWWTISSVA